MSIPVHLLGWMAGIVDLKGAVVRKKNQRRATPQLVLYVETKQWDVVRRLSSLTGTQPEFQEAKPVEEWMRRGCAEHCPDQHIHVLNHDYPKSMPPIARWTATGVAAAVIIDNLAPFLTTDRGWHELAVEATAQATLTGQGWGATRRALERLRALGWTLPPRFEAALTGPDEQEVVTNG